MLKDYQKMLAKFCEKNPQKSKKEVYDHFKAYGLAKSTIYRWHKQLEEGSFLNRRKVRVGQSKSLPERSSNNLFEISTIVPAVRKGRWPGESDARSNTFLSS